MNWVVIEWHTTGGYGYHATRMYNTETGQILVWDSVNNKFREES